MILSIESVYVLQRHRFTANQVYFILFRSQNKKTCILLHAVNSVKFVYKNYLLYAEYYFIILFTWPLLNMLG